MNSETFQHLNWLAVFLGGLGYFLLGALWYSKLLFAPKWIEYNKIDVNDPNAKKGMAALFIGSLFFMILSSFAIAILAYKMQTIGWFNGMNLGLFTGVCFGATALSISYLYEKKPLGLYLINGGYTVIGNIIAGIIICSL
jgi:MFS family permease